jgi:hypothetical protein
VKPAPILRTGVTGATSRSTVLSEGQAGNPFLEGGCPPTEQIETDDIEDLDVRKQHGGRGRRSGRPCRQRG